MKELNSFEESANIVMIATFAGIIINLVKAYIEGYRDSEGR